MFSNVFCLFLHTCDLHRHDFVLEQCGETWCYWVNHLVENIGDTTRQFSIQSLALVRQSDGKF